MNAAKNTKREQDRKMVYELDGRPSLPTAVPLGLQHVLAMFTSNLAPILIIASVCGLSGADTVTMVQCAMFVSGFTTSTLRGHRLCRGRGRRHRGRAGRVPGGQSGGGLHGLLL